MKKIFALFLLFPLVLFSQQPASTSSEMAQAITAKRELTQNSLVRQLPFRNIGPTVMSGRVVAFAVNPENPIEFYVGYASGGVWYTNNNGTSFIPIMDNAPTQNVGSLAANWNTGTLYVGTGEVNASRSSYAGIGLLRTGDQGKTWEHLGLSDTHHISSILLHPANPNEIVVAAIGHLYSPNQERGVFKSVDGGKSWNKTLFVNAQTGIIELEHSPSDFNTMYAAAWDKDRKAWNFRGSGENSGIYKSTDAGSTWKKIAGAGSGFPTGEGVGRIGLAVVDANTLYAIHDNQARREEATTPSDTDKLTKDDFKDMTTSQFLELSNDKLNAYLRTNGFQEKYKAENVKNMVRSGSVKPADLAKYLEDVNSQLFDTPVIGAEVYKSTDGGRTWAKTHEGYLDGIYYSYGYYFGKIHVSPHDPEAIYIYGVPILKSKDGGKTFTSIDADNVHADHHALWINPNRPGHLIDGNDGGINISYDDGEHWIKNNAPSVGQFYAVNVDHETPYNVYGGLQDNGVWVGPHTYEASPRWYQSGKYPYEMIMGGDGMQIEIDARNSAIVYTGFQFGNYFRLNRTTDETTYIQPKHELGDTPYRFNWQTPIMLSPHNQDILYLGANKMMRSMNQGTDWEAISGDLTSGGKPGNVAYGTLTSISESPFRFGLLYAGSDDGKLHVSQDAGGNWSLISGSFPKDLWVSRVVASAHKKERVYVSLNGYRWDDFKPYVYVSDNYGKTWENIASNLPLSPVNVIREDPENENLLYLGTDNGAYVSFDRGKHWEAFSDGLPAVAVHDMVIQEEAKDLVLGTHGRSIYLADIEILQQMTDHMNDLIIADIPDIRHSGRWGSGFSKWSDPYVPEASVHFFSPEKGIAKITLHTESGVELQEMEMEVIKGVNILSYDLSISEKGKKALEKEIDTLLKKSENGTYYLPKGTYTLTIERGDNSGKKEFRIK